MGDDGSGRRSFLRSAALGAGVVWSTPVVRHVQLVSAGGSPKPPPPTTGPPVTVTTYRFGGRFETAFAVPGTAPGCLPSGPVAFDATVDGVGPATVTQDICVGPLGATGHHLDGSFSLAVTGGTLTGTFVGRTDPIGVGASTHQDITITEGTGIFAGATGTGTVESELVAPPFRQTGVLAGQVDVPA